MSATDRPARAPILDCLRAVAVLLVLGRHVGELTPGLSPYLFPVLSAWRSFGWIGVDLFFVLSGFLVSGLIFQEFKKTGRVSPWRFLARRGFRIYPPFYFFLFTTWGSGLFGVPWRALLSESVFLQNYLGTTWNHTWSLAVEEHFYFFLIALCVLLVAANRGAPNPFERLPRFFVTIAAAVFCLRVLTFLFVRYSYFRQLVPTHLRIDSLFFGVVLSYFWAFYRQETLDWIRRHRKALALASAILLAPCVAMRLDQNLWVHTVGLSANYLGFGGILLLALEKGARPAAPGKPSRLQAVLAAIGVDSYSIYLWHLPVFQVMEVEVAGRFGQEAAIFSYFGGSILVGMFFARLIEMPFLRLRDRVLPALPHRPLASAPPSVAGA